MYRPKSFAEDRIDVLHQFIKEHPLATIVTAGPNGILANLIPVGLYPIGENGVLRCHLAKANDQAERIAVDDLLLIFQGPQSYVTPNFYATKKIHGKVVPTWNYSMVQVRGKATLIDDPKWILQQITDLTNQQESTQEKPWKVTDAPSEYIADRLRAIIGVEIQIENIEGKFKVSQNQPEDNRKGVEEGFMQQGNVEMASLVAKRHRT